MNRKEKTPDFLPCPFCGVLPMPEASFAGWTVACENESCKIQPTLLFPENSYEDAVAAWNDRPDKIIVSRVMPIPDDVKQAIRENINS